VRTFENINCRGVPRRAFLKKGEGQKINRRPRAEHVSLRETRLPSSGTEYKHTLEIAVRHAYVVLAKRDLYPFEFRVAISPSQSHRLDEPHILKIQTSDGEFEEKLDVPFEFIQNCGQPGAHDFDRIVDSLVTELLAKMRAAGHDRPDT
jgi:hypothetical protein